MLTRRGIYIDFGECEPKNTPLGFVLYIGKYVCAVGNLGKGTTVNPRFSCMFSYVGLFSTLSGTL